MKSLGQIAYEAYVAHSHGKSLISGQGLPDWEGQREDVQEAWEAAARAVGRTVLEKMDHIILGRVNPLGEI